MPSVHDVAAYILSHLGRMTAMKLQKLVYYSQAWALVWDERPLFPEKIRAWANGPVIRELYTVHRGQFMLGPKWPQGDATRLPLWARATVDAVLGLYGKKSSDWLSQLTHRENPWQEARRGLSPGQRGDAVISHASLAEYYGGL